MLQNIQIKSLLETNFYCLKSYFKWIYNKKMHIKRTFTSHEFLIQVESIGSQVGFQQTQVKFLIFSK